MAEIVCTSSLHEANQPCARLCIKSVIPDLDIHRAVTGFPSRPPSLGWKIADLLAAVRAERTVLELWLLVSSPSCRNPGCCAPQLHVSSLLRSRMFSSMKSQSLRHLLLCILMPCKTAEGVWHGLPWAQRQERAWQIRFHKLI